MLQPFLGWMYSRRPGDWSTLCKELTNLQDNGSDLELGPQVRQFRSWQVRFKESFSNTLSTKSFSYHRHKLVDITRAINLIFDQFSLSSNQGTVFRWPTGPFDQLKSRRTHFKIVLLFFVFNHSAFFYLARFIRPSIHHTSIEQGSKQKTGFKTILKTDLKADLTTGLCAGLKIGLKPKIE